ncbi:MAG: hypothetical protein HWN80_16245 [Candidatus Lokiarchaeota archaeon]|nr:hypothetical protein [Candidatus Lokiarchaeota archaeon]
MFYNSEEIILKSGIHRELLTLNLKSDDYTTKNIFENQTFSLTTPSKDSIYISKKFKVMRISLKKGLEVEPHHGSHPVLFLVLKGRGVLPTDSGQVELTVNEYIAYSKLNQEL